MKHTIKIALAVLIAVSIITAGVIVFKSVISKGAEQNIRITVVFKSLNEGMEFWDVVQAGIDVAAKEFGAKTEVLGAKYEREISRQIEILDGVIEKKPDAIVLVAADYNQLVPSVKKIKSAGIKLITIDSGINSDLPESFIATDNVQAGVKAGLEMAKLVDKDSEVAILSHVKGTATAIEREQGVRKGLAQSKITRIEDTLFSENNQEKATSIIKQLLYDKPQTAGIVCLNETSTLGAARAIKELNLAGKVKLVGFDGSINEVKLIEKGVIQATVVQKPFNMGYTGIEMAVRSIKGEKIKKRIDTGSVIVTKNNIYSPENEKLLFPFVDK
ncbi:MAG: substrate-binding domain-containing protein [Clostridia bacterium]|nr:substrate-binding domain-containing protein [Clostridia bacterium]